MSIHVHGQRIVTLVSVGANGDHTIGFDVAEPGVLVKVSAESIS